MATIGNLSLLLALTVQPNRWRTWFTCLDAPSDLCLLQTDRRLWQQPLFRQLIWRGYGVLPILFALVTAVILWAIGRDFRSAFVGFAIGWGMGIIVGGTVHLAAGLLVTLIVGTVTAIIASAGDLLTLDLFLGYNVALFFGLTSAIIIHVTSQTDSEHRTQSFWVQVGSVVLGLLGSFGIIALLIAGMFLLLQLMQVGSVRMNDIRIIFVAIPSILLTLAIFWRTRRLWATVIAAALIATLFYNLFGTIFFEYDYQPSGIPLLISFGTILLCLYLIMLVLPYNLTERYLRPRPAAITAAIATFTLYPAIEQIIPLFPHVINGVIAVVLFAAAFFSTTVWSLLSYPFAVMWNTINYQLDVRAPLKTGTRFGRNTVFWDDLQRFRLPHLDTHLLLTRERDSDAGQAAMQRLETGKQRWATQSVRVELDAQRLADCTTVADIGAIHTDLAAGLLATPAGMILWRLKKTSEDVAAALAQPTRYNQRIVLQTVATQLNNLSLELRRSDEPYRERFLPIIDQWQNAIAQAAETLQTELTTHNDIPNPYIIGVPLTQRQAIFVGRTDISRRIEGFLREDNYPPLLLYGQRRMGKTSLLYQLRWLLPSTILPLVLDLQGAISLATTHAGFLYNLARGMVQSAAHQQIVFPAVNAADFADEPFTQFDIWLDQFETHARQHNIRTILLALDEFEALDSALTRGDLDPDMILGFIRHLIQHRPMLRVMLAGSHSLAEFTRWSHYLVNAQTIHVSYLSYDATEQLITRPIADFPLRYTADAITRIWELTHGHPYLTQLVCTELVEWKNDQSAAERTLATAADVNAIIPDVLQRGQQFFADIAHNQLDTDSLSLLRQLAENPQLGVAREAARPLLDKELVAYDEDGYLSFQAELFQHVHDLAQEIGSVSS